MEQLINKVKALQKEIDNINATNEQEQSNIDYASDLLAKVLFTLRNIKGE